MSRSSRFPTRSLAIGSAVAALLLLGVAPAAAAEWTAPTSLVLHAAPRANVDPSQPIRFWGQLKSRKQECVGSQTISLLRKGTGGAGDTVVATTTTDGKGRFEFPPQTLSSTGRWQGAFAGSTEGTHPNIHTCLGSVSAVLGITVVGGLVVSNPPTVGAGVLGVTGSEAVLPLGGLAVLLAVAGTAFLWVGRRRGRRARTGG